jgi:rhodanese-related sulfurtransferase
VIQEADLQEFRAARADGRPVVDVREPYEYLAGHVPGAQLVPLGQLPGRWAELTTRWGDLAEGPVYVICASGNRSLVGARILRGAGVDARSVAGGTAAWEASGGPVVSGAHPEDR